MSGVSEKVTAAFARVGAAVPRVLLPASGVSLEKFAVIACDQFSARPEYWDEVVAIADGVPSAVELMLPEAWLGSERDDPERITGNMRRYLDSGVFAPAAQGAVAVRRTTDSGVRSGLMLALDLEQYDYSKNSRAMIRATEATVVERLPARIALRERAPLEMPHVLVLVDDRKGVFAAALNAAAREARSLYDFELMLGGGHIRGDIIDTERPLLALATALGELLDDSGDGFLYAMGDGNHSFAAAKARWDALKPQLSAEQRQSHPARWALAEIISLYDPGLSVKPIHRLLTGDGALDAPRQLGFDPLEPPSLQQLQPQLDEWLAKHPQLTLEYIHGADECRRLAQQTNGLAIVFPAFEREGLFDTVRERGAFVRKSFSLGEAREKRYYLECREIV